MCIRDRYIKAQENLNQFQEEQAKVEARRKQLEEKVNRTLNYLRRVKSPVANEAVSYTHLDVYKRQAFSDTIFAIFAEEFGFIGSIILISGFFFVLYRGFVIAKRAPDKLGFLLATSITIWITIQATLHIASNVALIPINGNTLPFISYGGSSTIVNLTAIGLLLNISRSNKDIKQRPQNRVREIKSSRRGKKVSKLSKINPKKWINTIFD